MLITDSERLCVGGFKESGERSLKIEFYIEENDFNVLLIKHTLDFVQYKPSKSGIGGSSSAFRFGSKDISVLAQNDLGLSTAI